ncbi:hypothetical protein EX30DRAFT_350786 [Ascodesmis nigricans]|uniref:C2H2-type domain-containing protein n=1 Tax=Ascodesmis nigricans TaxID=341454 RepID=A0A4S2MNK4_9PEZI|nr:hypothetical protein EX30DRAFT_350786 [Ascodesmis nigricans]
MDLLEIVHDRGHLTGDSDEPKPFKCHDENCNKRFNRKSDLQRHYRIHTNERPYQCHVPNCGKAFIQRSALTVHLRVHTGEKPHKCEYIGCGKCFSDSSSLARHRRIHTGKRPYRCEVPGCEKSFCRKTTLTKHQRRTHRVRDFQGSYPEEYLNSSEQDADGSDTEMDTPRHSVSPPSRFSAPQLASPADSTKLQNVKRNGIARRMTPSSLQPTAHHMFHDGPHGPLTPHSPVSAYSTPISASPNVSYAAPVPFTSPCGEDYHYPRQQPPPTPRSPHHHQSLIMVKQEQGLHQSPPSELLYSTTDYTQTPTATTPPSHDMRIVCKPPGAYDLISEAQALQHSPGSLSSCSSLSTASHASADYFCDAPSFQASYPNVYPVHLQQIAHYQTESQDQLPMAHMGLGAPFTHQPQQQQFLMPVHHPQYHQPATPPPPQQPQQQQMWLEVPPYQHQLLHGQDQRQQECFGALQRMCIKEEPLGMVPSSQPSFCE